MKTIIAGSRSIASHDRNGAFLVENYDRVRKAIECSGFDITEVVSGRAHGVDRLGEYWADENGISVQPFPVLSTDWKRLGKATGPIRNAIMAEYADACIVVWAGKSEGSRSMIEIASAYHLKVHVEKLFANSRQMSFR